MEMLVERLGRSSWSIILVDHLGRESLTSVLSVKLRGSRVRVYIATTPQPGTLFGAQHLDEGPGKPRGLPKTKKSRN
jgi:hypothetical protein